MIKKLLFPARWLIALLTIISTVALVFVFLKRWEKSVIAYAVYVLAFYTLSVICIACWKGVPEYYNRVKDKVYENQFANRYMTDVAFKTHVSLYVSLSVNVLYIAMNAVFALVYSTSWFVIFAVYYAIMAIMRFLLVRYVNQQGIGKRRFGELKRARLCAYILMIVNVVLSGAILMMVYQGRGFEYEGMFIYVMAAYTFYITITAVLNLFKYRKYNSPIMSFSRVIKLAAAMFSMLSLETAMFSQFGSDASPQMQRIMIMATGGGIAVIVVITSVYTIVKSTREIKKLRVSFSNPQYQKARRHR